MRKFEDDLSKVKLGRYDEAEERRFERLLRVRLLKRRSSLVPSISPAHLTKPRVAPLLSDAALNVSTRMLTFEYGPKGREAVLKAPDAPPMTIGSVRALVRYIARVDAHGRSKADCEPVRVFDGFGREVSPEDLKSEVDSWRLAPDKDNLSKQARKALALGDDDAFCELGNRQRHRNVQARHFVFSVDAEEDRDGTAAKFHAASLVTIERQFTEMGYPCVWAMHRDKEEEGKLHVHVVVRAMSDHGHRIRCDKNGDYVFSMRVELASNLRRVGLDYIATRREDRWALRQNIYAGTEPLRKNLSMAEIKAGGGDLTRRVPIWWAMFGEEAVANWVGSHRSRRLVKAVVNFWPATSLRARRLTKDRAKLPKNYHSIYDEFATVFQDPLRAVTHWHWMAREGGALSKDGTPLHPNRSLAIWYLRKQPAVFGRTVSGPRSVVKSEKLLNMLRSIELPVVDDKASVPAQLPFPTDEISDLHRQKVERDRRRVSASLNRIASIAEARGLPAKVVEDIRWRAKMEARNPPIDSDALPKRARTPGVGQSPEVEPVSNMIEGRADAGILQSMGRRDVVAPSRAREVTRTHQSIGR